MKWFARCAVGASLGLAALSCMGADAVKIGFIVKQPEEPWFQSEWKFAQAAAQADGFVLIKIGAPDGEKLMSAIDNLGVQGAKGVIVCTPNTKLGTAIVLRAKANSIKLMSVDDRLLGSDGKPIEAVPHMGISAVKIGELVGETIAAEMHRRGFKPEETAAIRVSFDGLQTARERTAGAESALVAAGFPKQNIFDAAQRTTDTEGSFNAALPILNKHGEFRHWVIFALNDESVLGAVRATESARIAPADVIGVGIGGAATAAVEFSKKSPTGFYATVVLSAKRHGYETADLMYRWVTAGTPPPALTLTTGSVATRDTYATIKQD
jgi:L-arabinose transport system substrate-binding protein